MKVSIGIGGAASNAQRDFQEHVAFVTEAEKLGVDAAWSAEAWGQDAVTPLAYLAARTERIRLGTGIMQISARTPSMTAMTALSLAAISGDRFLLGLGVSGPQVVEGLQGRPFRAPLTRLRETVDIVRLGLRRRAHPLRRQAPSPAAARAARARRCGSPRAPIRTSRSIWPHSARRRSSTLAKPRTAGSARPSCRTPPMPTWRTSARAPKRSAGPCATSTSKWAARWASATPRNWQRP